MISKGSWFFSFLLVCTLFCTANVYASKTTDLLSAALKQRSSGNLKAAIKGFGEAVNQAPSVLQRNLALFMLGDCQMEVGRYRDAVKTFSELSKKGITADERAEALYKLMEANSSLGDTSAVKKAFSELKKSYSGSAYYEVGAAFMKAEKVLDSNLADISVDSDTRDSKPDNSTVASIVKPKDKQPEKKKDSVVKSSNKVAEKTKTAAKSEGLSDKKKIAGKNPETEKKQEGRKLDDKTTSILSEVLRFKPITDSERDDLVSRILAYQDKLKGGEQGSGKDRVLFELAEATARFGELLEACKLYDKLLALHPASVYVEESYYQAIRLRAILGVHRTVIEWARAFNISFPNSKYKANVSALVAYSQVGGRVLLPKQNVAVAENPSRTAEKQTAGTNSVASKKLSVEEENLALKASSLYKSALKKMNDGAYSSALGDLKVLSSSFPNSSQLWWDTSLIYVQLEEFKEARKSIRKMLLLDPNNSDANSLLGYIQYRLENYGEAATAYEQAGESGGEGVTFYDTKKASERMKKNVSQ